VERRHFGFLGVALGGVLLLGTAVAYRWVISQPPVVREKAALRMPEASVHEPAQLKSVPPPAPPGVIAQATEQVRLRGTYQNYRRAVASQDSGLQKAILPVLLRDREAAARMAEEDLARAGTDLDRDVARQMISVLRR
jgi:hypothetical protein